LDRWVRLAQHVVLVAVDGRQVRGIASSWRKTTRALKSRSSSDAFQGRGIGRRLVRNSNNSPASLASSRSP
jgi:hypothetical protein